MAKIFKAPKVGETLGPVKLKNLYDRFVVDVLGSDYLTLIEKKGKKRDLYKVRKELPSLGEYIALKDKKYATTVAQVISDAQAEIEALTEEMRSWYDSLPENLQQGDRGNALEEAASNLEQINLDDPPDVLKLLNVLVYPCFGSSSRASRASEAAGALRAAAEAIGHFCHLLEPDSQIGFNIDTTQGVVAVVDWAELRESADQLVEAADNLEDIEFPGMYG